MTPFVFSHLFSSHVPTLPCFSSPNLRFHPLNKLAFSNPPLICATLRGSRRCCRHHKALAHLRLPTYGNGKKKHPLRKSATYYITSTYPVDDFVKRTRTSSNVRLRQTQDSESRYQINRPIRLTELLGSDKKEIPQRQLYLTPHKPWGHMTSPSSTDCSRSSKSKRYLC